MRILIVLLAVVAAILTCAIYVTANVRRHARAEAALAEAQSQAEEARQNAPQRIETLERENADLRKQLELAKTNLDRGAEKLTAAEHETSRLRGDLDAALKQLAELSRKYAEAEVKKAEDSTAETVKKETAVPVAITPPAAAEDVHADIKNRGVGNGNNGNVAGNRRRGPVASLPRTTPSFSELDTNHDGRLSLKEYKAGYPDVADVEDEFKLLDTNGDGWLSIDEYKAGHPDPPVVPTKRARRRN